MDERVMSRFGIARRRWRMAMVFWMLLLWFCRWCCWVEQDDNGVMAERGYGEIGFSFLLFSFFPVFFFQDMKEGIRSNFLKKIKIKTREDERDRKGLDLLICSNLLEIYEDLVEILWRYGRDVWRSGRDLWRLNKDCVIGAMKKRKRGKIGVFQFDFLFFFLFFSLPNLRFQTWWFFFRIWSEHFFLFFKKKLKLI